jgi:hypothetical protein
MLGNRAYKKITSTVPFLKSYKPITITEVVSAKFQQAITFKKGTVDVIFVDFQKDDVISDNFHVGHMP